MRKADGNKQLVTILSRQLGADPVAVGWRAFADVNGDVKNSAANAADQFILAAWGHLEVQAAQRKPRLRERMIILHKAAGDSEGGKGWFRINFGEPTAGIAMAFGAYELDGGQRAPFWPYGRRPP